MGMKDYEITVSRTACLKKTKHGHLKLSLWLISLPFIALMSWGYVFFFWCIFMQHDNLILH